METVGMPEGGGRVEIRGASDHNLKGVDVAIAHGAWTAVVGPSGSGKTTLVFDTLVREGERRYLASLSPKARQFFGKLGRARADGIRGLPVPIAVGRRSVTSHPRSTVGTLSGVADLLRLVFAREASAPGEAALTRSHFSFNVPVGACDACGGLGEEDRVDPGLLIADATKSIRAGALVPTLKSGYTVYSQVTVDVMDTICRAHGFDVDTPWNALTEEQQGVVFHGTRALKVPFGKHSLESRMKWEGITARPREEGYYKGIVTVIEETLQRGRNPNIMRFVHSEPCRECDGSRLGAMGREARLADGTHYPDLMSRSARDLRETVEQLDGGPTLGAVLTELTGRLDRMVRLGLGHLAFDRASPTLSGGEAQRLRLASQLTAGLTGTLVALDEPTLGLHPDSRAGMRDVLDELVGGGSTLVVVEHDPDMVEFADRVLALGPGAGPDGGEIVATLDESEGALGGEPEPCSRGRAGGGLIRLTGATLHNLQDAQLEVPTGTLHVVLGPSGAGKSSLVFGTLLPALSGDPSGPFSNLELDASAGRVHAVDARPMGRSSRSVPATWSGIFDAVRQRFAAMPAAKERRLAAGAFSFNQKGGRCDVCEGLGRTRVGLHLLEDALEVCAACDGTRYGDSVREVLIDGRSIADVLAMTASEALTFFRGDGAIEPTLQAMVDLGIGHLALGTPSTDVSSGEAQRIRLGTLVAQPAKAPSLYVFDEPDRGLHPGDIERLIEVLQRLVDQGHTVLAISHHRSIWAAADGCTEVREGIARPVPYAELVPAPAPPRAARPAPPTAIEIRGARTHNLKGIDVRIPYGKLTGIAGPSGSGKSSLAFDTLAAEAWGRFAESLPFQVRRFTQRMPRPDVESMTGLTPVIALRQSAADPSARSTVATQSALGPVLRLLWARAGVRSSDDTAEALTAGHFVRHGTLGACRTCSGAGVLPTVTPGALVTDGGLPLMGGAMAGTKAGAFFTEPDGQYMATLRAAAGHDLAGPWDELPSEVQGIALGGTGATEYDVAWSFSKGGRSGTHEFKGPWEGLLELARRESVRRGRTKTGAKWLEVLEDVPCAACDGRGLRRDLQAVRVGDLTWSDVGALAVSDLVQALDGAAGGSPAYAGLRAEIAERCADLEALGLGGLVLAQSATDLDMGALQRLRLSAVLGSGLTSTTVVLDEPDAGLSDDEVDRVLGRLRELVAGGNTVVVVSHRPSVLGACDHLLMLGPGAGEAGGSLVAEGSAPEVLARMAAESVGTIHAVPGTDEAREVDGHSIPMAGFVAVLGPGAARFVTERAPEVLGIDFEDVRVPSRRVGARTPLGALDLMPAFQALYHGAQADRVLPKAAFSFLSPKGRCPECKGRGTESVALDFAADLALPCPACKGARFAEEVLDVRWNGRNAAECLRTSVAALEFPAGRLASARSTLMEVGLGHLALGRATSSLSGGEVQRLALAAALLGAPPRSLHLYLHPDTGLSQGDLAGPMAAIRRLADAGGLVIAAVHRPEFLELASAVIDLRDH